jgi:hypothetical protein
MRSIDNGPSINKRDVRYLSFLPLVLAISLARFHQTVLANLTVMLAATARSAKSTPSCKLGTDLFFLQLGARFDPEDLERGHLSISEIAMD